MRSMVRSIALSSTLCLALGSSAAFFAQDSTTPPPAGQAAQGGGMRHGPMSPDQELTHLTKQLNLTADQQTQIKPILTDRQSQLQQIHQDTSMARPDKMAKMKSVDDDSNTKLEAVLNDQQKPKYEQMLARRKQHMQQMRAQQGGAQPPAGTGAQPQ